jgi:hypothetical protein
MAKWSVYEFDGEVELRSDGCSVACVDGYDNARDIADEIARKLNAFDEMLSLLKLIVPAYDDARAWTQGRDLVLKGKELIANAEGE